MSLCNKLKVKMFNIFNKMSLSSEVVVDGHVAVEKIHVVLLLVWGSCG